MDWRELWGEVRNPSCNECSLAQVNPKHKICLPGVGPVPCDQMWVGEAPGKREQDTETPFQGPVGKYLDQILKFLNMDRNSAYITNAVKCHPPYDETPTDTMVKACRHYLLEEIKLVQPKKIMLLGGTPLNSIFGKGKITAYRGKSFIVDFGIFSSEVYPIFHPGYVRRNPRFYPVFYTDLRRFNGTTSTEVQTDYAPVMDMSTFYKVSTRLLKSPEVSFDLETTHLDPWTGAKIICIGLSDQEGWARTIPLESPFSPWTDQQLKDIYRILGVILNSPHRDVITFNAKFDCMWMTTRGVKTKCDFDAMMAAYILDENLPNNLVDVTKLYLNPDFSKPNPDHINSWTWEEIWPYNCGDADWTLRLSHVLRERLKREPTSEVIFKQLVMPAQTEVLPQLELNGIYVVPEKVAEARKKCEEEARVSKANIMEHVPADFVLPVKSRKALKAGFNPDSPKQLGKLLFETLKLPIIAYTETKDYSTAEAVLIELKGKHPIIDDIMLYRQYSKNINTFLDPWDQLKDSNGFIHPHFHQKTITGRLSSSDPNLQQVPRDPLIRNCLGAPPGWKLIASDYSQIEMRLAGHYSQDPEILKAYNTGVDIHVLTLSLITDMTVEAIMERLGSTDKITKGKMKELRKKAKAVNFGLIYGMSAEGLQEYAKVKYEIDMTLAEAQAWRKAYFDRYKRLLPWHEEQRQKVYKDHKVISHIGRVRHLYNILSSDQFIRSEAERQAINSPVQGLASDLCLLAAIEVCRIADPREIKIVGLVHDSAMYLVREDRAEYWKEKIKYIMTHPPIHIFNSAPLTVPIEVDIEIAQYWS